MRTLILLLSIFTFMNSTAQDKILIQNGLTTLNVKVYSKNNIETIILLHGGPGVPDDMLEVVSQLKDCYKVITFEQRGVGESICFGCSFKMEDYISDIDAIAKELNIDKFHLFGHSWGGLYAQIYASKKPENIKSLFLCSPGSGTNKTWKKTENEVMVFNKDITTSKEWFNMGWNSLLGMFGSDNGYQKVFSQVLKNYHKGYGDVKIEQEFLEKIHSRPINKTRKEIKKYPSLKPLTASEFPILITYGDGDVYGNSKNDLLKRYPTATVETIKNSGHIPWKHNLNEFNKLLNAFYNN